MSENNPTPRQSLEDLLKDLGKQGLKIRMISTEGEAAKEMTLEELAALGDPDLTSAVATILEDIASNPNLPREGLISTDDPEKKVRAMPKGSLDKLLQQLIPGGVRDTPSSKSPLGKTDLLNMVDSILDPSKASKVKAEQPPLRGPEPVGFLSDDLKADLKAFIHEYIQSPEYQQGMEATVKMVATVYDVASSARGHFDGTEFGTKAGVSVLQHSFSAMGFMFMSPFMLMVPKDNENIDTLLDIADKYGLNDMDIKAAYSYCALTELMGCEPGAMHEQGSPLNLTFGSFGKALTTVVAKKIIEDGPSA